MGCNEVASRPRLFYWRGYGLSVQGFTFYFVDAALYWYFIFQGRPRKTSVNLVLPGGFLLGGFVVLEGLLENVYLDGSSISALRVKDISVPFTLVLVYQVVVHLVAVVGMRELIPKVGLGGCKSL